MRDQIVLFIVALFYIAILYMLVRPSSKGAAIIGQVTGTLADLVRGVSGQTYNASTKSWSMG